MINTLYYVHVQANLIICYFTYLKVTIINTDYF